MNIQIDGSKEELDTLAAFLADDSRFNNISQQLRAALAFEEHHQEDDVPRPGDHPLVERSE
jgi:hypothetical protein